MNIRWPLIVRRVLELRTSKDSRDATPDSENFNTSNFVVNLGQLFEADFVNAAILVASTSSSSLPGLETLTKSGAKEGPSVLQA